MLLWNCQSWTKVQLREKDYEETHITERCPLYGRLKYSVLMLIFFSKVVLLDNISCENNKISQVNKLYMTLEITTSISRGNLDP